MPDITRQLRITGHVQGVAYRAWTRAQAEKLGLTAWVRIEGDGSVTALIHGPAEAVDAMITACHVGPGAADVRDVQVTEATSPATTGFAILR
jgi:acylphosphatase